LAAYVVSRQPNELKLPNGIGRLAKTREKQLFLLFFDQRLSKWGRITLGYPRKPVNNVGVGSSGKAVLGRTR
jgi:hypothetical protein